LLFSEYWIIDSDEKIAPARIIYIYTKFVLNCKTRQLTKSKNISYKRKRKRKQATMVIGLLTITSIPTVAGMALGVREQRNQNSQRADARRMAKFNIDAYCEANSEKAKEVQGKRVVLKDNKVYLDDPHPSLRKEATAYTALAFYIGYPDDDRKRGDGLVTSVSDNPPMLNWIYVDKNSFELRYGNRSQSIEHLVGHWDWTKDETGITLEGEELFAAVEEEPGVWAVYCDCYRDGLAGIAQTGKTIVEISLDRSLVEGEKDK